MKHFMKKAALFLALVLMITSMPVSAKAAATPEFVKKQSTVYENSSAKGVYKYTVTGLKKGYKVKWGITGGGKKYVTLKYKTRTATGSQSSNKITIDTNGDTKAMNKKFNVVAKVYDTNGKLIETLKDKPTIKVCAEAVAIDTTKAGSLEGLAVGTYYQFNGNMTPANATSEVYWTVKSTDGVDHSSEIDSDGKWKPTAAGEYIITATARNSKNGKALCAASVKATVGVYLKSVTQTGANELKAVFSADVTNKLSKNNFFIKAKSGTSGIIPETFVYDTIGKTVTITTRQNFKDSVEYVVTYGTSTKSFTASAGEPVAAKILTETVPANTLIPIEYALYDKNNIDVTNLCEGEVVIEATVVNGYKSTENELFMMDIGSTTTVKLTYKPKNGGQEIVVSKTVTCVEVEVEEAATTDFTITSTAAAPDYEASDYKAVTTISLGEKGYAHFRALDEKGNVLPYDSITYSSSDDNILIIASDGQLTPIKTGTVNVFVTVKRGETELPYIYQVTIKEAKKLTNISLSRNAVTMSDTAYPGYQETVDVIAYDQYGNEMDLSGAIVNITELGNKNVYADYDYTNQNIVIKDTYVTGNYSYKVTVSVNGKSVYAILGLTVKTVPATGTYTYAIQVEDSTVDMALTSTTAGNKITNVRLAQYKGGVFAGYTYFDSVKITKGGKYYSADLTAGGSTSVVSTGVYTDTDTLTLTAMRLIAGEEVGECKKAEEGTYNIVITYYDSNTNSSRTIGTTIRLKDTQEKPVVTVQKLTSDTTVSDALALVRNCVTVSSGEIYSCTATGETAVGSQIAISSGRKIHIEEVSVRELIKTGDTEVPQVYIYHTIEIGQTLTNR